jgi:hypothetical protein
MPAVLRMPGANYQLDEGQVRRRRRSPRPGLDLGAEQESSQLAEAMELRRKAVETRAASLGAGFEAERRLHQ